MLMNLGLVLVAATYLIHTTTPIKGRGLKVVSHAYAVGWILILFGGIGALLVA